jgi:hypothetical protein
MGSLFKGKAGKVPAPTDIWSPKKGKKGKVIGPSVAQQQLSGVTGYYGQALPAFLGMEAQYAPQFIEQAFRTGEQAYGGLAALQRRAGEEAAQQMANLRSQELGAMTGQAGQTRGLMEALSPEQARSIELQRQYAERAQGLESEFQGQAAPYTGMFGAMAQEAFARRGTLSPEEQRAAQQRARESAAAAGRIGGNAAISAEMLNREAAQAARRAEAAQSAGLAYSNIADVGARRQALRGEASDATGELFNRAGSFYTAPGLELLTRTPASYGAGTSMATSGLGLGREIGPQLDYNLPMSLARERAGALDQASLAQYQANQQAKASRAGMIGSLAGLAAIPFTGGLSAGLGLTGLAGGAAGATGMSGLGLSAGMGLANMFGGTPRATPV